MAKSAENQYLDLCRRILDEGVWVENERTGKKCLTVINADLEYSADDFPILNTKKSFWKMAVAEMLGYIKGFTNAEDFRKLGTTTWDANANETEAWLLNPFRKGEDDMGRVYGAIARDTNDYHIVSEVTEEQEHFLISKGYDYCGDLHEHNMSIYYRQIDQLRAVYEDLKAGKDNRFEMITFHNPAEVDFGCLRSCMYSHHFSILGDTLYLNSTQRSVDTPLGLPFNMIQCYFLLAVMAQITGLKMGKVYHKLVNVHFYEDQIDAMKTQLRRTPWKNEAKFIIDDNIKTLEDLENATLDNFDVRGYRDQGRIDFPFSA